ncbi:hypothetical protein [Ruegeria sp. ANG-S4]|nr:hypothetical protein [Ruegeria sp. ANG-S4]
MAIAIDQKTKNPNTVDAVASRLPNKNGKAKAKTNAANSQSQSFIEAKP